MSAEAQIPFVFLLGKERSGTSLLQLMLNAHPQIIAPTESRFIILLHKKYGSLKSWDEKNIRDFCNDLLKEKLFSEFWPVKKEALEKKLIAVKEKLDYAAICRIVYQQAFPEKNASLLVDKNPLYCFFIDELRTIFPEAKFIHLVRDYRGNVLSHRQAFKTQNIRDIAYRWLRVNQKVEKLKAEIPDRVITVKYESLVANPENELKGICDFLGISFSPQMLDAHEKRVNKGTRAESERFNRIHQSLQQPLDRVHADKWKSQLEPEAVKTAEKVAGDFAAEKYGYARTTSALQSANILAAIKFFFFQKIVRMHYRNKMTSALVRSLHLMR